MSRDKQQLSITTTTKINAWLRILPRQNETHLHELESLFLPVAYGDHFLIEACPSEEPELLLSSNRKDLLAENTVQTAWKAFVSTLSPGQVQPSYRIIVHLEKRVPEKTGLGGGSGDAGAMLLTLNQLHGSPLSEHELLSIAMRLGSDVPFFVQNSVSIVRGTGQIVDRIPPLPPLWCCIALPTFRVNTSQAYAVLDEVMATQGVSAVDPTVDLDSIVNVLRAGTALPDHGKQRLNSFEAALGDNLAAFLDIRTVLLTSGAILSGLSGSGSAVFGIYTERATAEAAALAVQERRSVDRTFVAEVL
ncbi:MAG: hypothetical protein ABFD13_05555 [Candidatus Cryosericum sp.]|nr:hypothetical protein [bacterium]